MLRITDKYLDVRLQESMDKQSVISEAQRLLAHARSAKASGALNIAPTEKDRARFKQEMASVDWNRFVQSADYHYFVGRVLLSQQVHLYGLLCTHQCVENYLKAYIAFRAVPVDTVHELLKLLQKARNNTPDSGSFIHSEDIETICEKFEPFYEIARYPVQITRPKDCKYIVMPSVELAVLDYFVLQMRRILILPPGSWDLLSEEGHIELQMVKELRPEFYAIFKEGNINCA